MVDTSMTRIIKLGVLFLDPAWCGESPQTKRVASIIESPRNELGLLGDPMPPSTTN